MAACNDDLDVSTDAAATLLRRGLSISHFGPKRQHSPEAHSPGDDVPSDGLPCGHVTSQDYLCAWWRHELEQRQIRFTCPRYDVDKKRICGAAVPYSEVCQLAGLTPEDQQLFEETLAFVAAARLCDFKLCPGCSSNVERADVKNLCVRCTICSARRRQIYQFCWQCRREWKGPFLNATRCANDGCGQKQGQKTGPLKLCHPEFKREKLRAENDDIYPSMDKSPNRTRLALLINNINFQHLSDRTGAEKDERSMGRLLKDLGYEVVLLRNLTAQGMDAALQDFSRREVHVNSDSCFVVIMSHGSSSGICGVSHLPEEEEDIFPTNQIYNHLNTPNCPGLRDKPKIILIQACRGGEDGSIIVEDSVPVGGRRKEHREKDLSCLRSCTPDTVSYRDVERGTDFIRETVEIFNLHAHEDHVEELFRKVLKKFKEIHPDQMPCKERTTLSRKFYLFPGQ